MAGTHRAGTHRLHPSASGRILQHVTPSQVADTPVILESPSSPLPPPPAPPTSRLRALTGPLVLTGAGLAASAYIYLNNPNNPATIYPKCPLKYLTGIDCPGCGLTRSVYSLLHGDPLAAISHNLLILFVIPWLVMAVVRWGAQRLGHEIPKMFEVRQWMVPAMVVLLVVFTVVRNLPYEPFHWLNSGALSG